MFSEPPLNLPFVTSGLGHGWLMHAPNEYLEVEGLRICEKSAAAFLCEYGAITGLRRLSHQGPMLASFRSAFRMGKGRMFAWLVRSLVLSGEQSVRVTSRRTYRRWGWRKPSCSVFCPGARGGVRASEHKPKL